MGISQMKKWCVGGGQKEGEYQNIYTIIASDFNNFERERWFTFQNPMLFDPNKFIFLYPNYYQEQTLLLNRWKSTIDIRTIQYGQNRNEEDVLSTRWKYAIKRGVPIQYYKTIISVIFNKNFMQSKIAYEKIKSEINFNEPMPLFGLDEITIKQALNSPFLNEKGYAVMRQLMYAFKRKKGEIFYNRYIGSVSALLLIFFQDYQVYDLMTTMMEESSHMSINRAESLRWHFVFKEEQMKNLANTFFIILRQNSESISKIEKHLQTNNIDKVEVFNAIVQNFFYSFVPFSFILHIFILFLNEGVKIFYRILYCIMIYAERQIYESNSINRCLNAIRKKCLMMSSDEIKLILKKSFNVNLKLTVSPSLVESRLKKQQTHRRYYFLPFISETSDIISYDDLENIWGYLPYELKTYDLKVVYSQNSKPYSLKALLKSLEISKYSFILIRTTKGHIFGAFFIGFIHAQERKEWYGNNQNFIFTLKPKPNKYISTRMNNQFIFTGNGTLEIGHGYEGSALVLNQNLQYGEGYKCATFGNEPLCEQSGQFQICCIQAFTLH